MSDVLQILIALYCVTNCLFLFHRFFLDRQIESLKKHHEHEIKIHKGNYLTAQREIEMLDALNKKLLNEFKKSKGEL